MLREMQSRPLRTISLPCVQYLISSRFSQDFSETTARHFISSHPVFIFFLAVPSFCSFLRLTFCWCLSQSVFCILDDSSQNKRKNIISLLPRVFCVWVESYYASLLCSSTLWGDVFCARRWSKVVIKYYWESVLFSSPTKRVRFIVMSELWAEHEALLAPESQRFKAQN